MKVKSNLLGTYTQAGLEFDLTSDNHHPLIPNQIEAGRSLAKSILSSKRSELLFLLGDHFEAEGEHREGLDSSEATNTLLAELSPHYQHIIYLVGNHCLRRPSKSVNPWADFDLPDNVYSPIADQPKIVEIGGRRILLGNIFYDFNFLKDPQYLGLTKEALIDFFRQTTDGKSLLRGADSIMDFEGMTNSLASALTPDIDIMATHCLPHPSLVSFRAERMTKALRTYALASGVNIVVNPQEDASMASREGVRPENFRSYWNQKSFMMGSDVLGHPNAQPKEGLTVLYGHNHRGGKETKNIGGKTVHFLTHQRFYQ